MRLNLSLVFASSLMVVSLAGCDGGDLFTTAPGQYQGLVLTKTSGTVKQALVAAEVVAISKREVRIRSKSADAGAAIDYGLKAESSKKVSLSLPQAAGSPVALRASSKNCFSTDTKAAPPAATLCFNGVDLTLDLSWDAHGGAGGDALTLSFSRATGGSLPALEQPRAYTVEQLLKRAMAQNFDSPIQFEHVVQAKLKTETAYLNLIPHIEINGVLNIAAFNLLGVLKAVGDIVPFLFPNRWMAAREAHFRSEAEFDAWILTKADAANVAEGLGLSVARDLEVIGRVEEYRKFIVEIRDQIRNREKAGLMQAGASDDIESVINNIDKGVSALAGSAIQERAALAQAAGFYNAAAVTAVEPLAAIGVDRAVPYDEAGIEKLSSLALARSYELRQMNALVEASHLSTSERYFQWLDPSGDRDGALGVSLVPYVKIGTSQTQELLAKRQKLEAGLLDSVARSASALNQAIEAYGLARAGYAIQTRRIERHLSNLKSGINFSMADLSNALQEKLKNEIELINHAYAYEIARGNLDRELLSGPYAWLPTDRGERAWVVPADGTRQ